jgi:hypothetical protein
MLKMSRRGEVRIPPKRLHLLGVFCVSLLTVVCFSVFLRFGLLPSLEQHQSFFEASITALVLICDIVAIPLFALFALWALARLVFNLPALILTPEGIVNHSIIYHVVLPWREIDQLVRDLTPAPPSTSFSTRQQWKRIGATILVLAHDQRRLYAQQQPLTRALLWAFTVMRPGPTNIYTGYLALSQEEVWRQLQRYAHETVGATQIKFVTIQPKMPGRS